jgi:small subunit ribosomal protein S6
VIQGFRAKRRKRIVQAYETLFIINPDLEEDGITRTIEIVQDVITAGGGTVLKVDKWGRRQLAYQVQKKREGYYVLLYFQAPPTLIDELNRRYKLTDTIMRYLVVQLRKTQEEEILRSASLAESTAPAEPSDLPAHDEDKQDDMVESEAEEKQRVSKEG